MGTAPLEANDPESTRCPMCGKGDVVPTLQRKWWDRYFRLMGKHPWVCRACEWRFYVKRRS